MPIFMRSLSGLRNYSLFTKKDITAYCEGGAASINVADAVNGISNAGAEDVTFWEIVTTSCAPRKSFHIKAIGDCNAVHAVADHIILNNIPSSCTFIDRDWRDFDGTMRKSDIAIYTPSYAWENTVVRSEVIADAILSLGHLPRSHYQPALEAAENFLNELTHALRMPIYMDISSIGSGASFIEKNERCGGVISNTNTGGLKVDRSLLLARFKRERQKYVKNIDVKISDAGRRERIPGHVLMGAAIAIVQSYLKQAGVKSHSAAAIRATLLQQFKQSFSNASWLTEHRYLRKRLANASL